MANDDRFNIDAVQAQLQELGWVVVPSVIPAETCDDYVLEIKQWLKQFGSEFPKDIHSIIHEYNISHIAPAWKARLHAKHVFADLWKTEKLHTSLDGIAIGRPPELGATSFDDIAKGANQLHLDQGPKKSGLHAYQGAVYLEEAKEDDWTFMVMENSHKFHKEFFKQHQSSSRSEFRKLAQYEVQWYEEKGCVIKRLEIPKGGIVLWDSRTVHAGAPPFRERENPRRWRYVVFASMTPAIWSNAEDIKAKKESYRDMRVSRHWSSQGFSMFRECKKHPYNITVMPDVGTTMEARLLAGDVDYDFADVNSNGPKWKPVFKN